MEPANQPPVGRLGRLFDCLSARFRAPPERLAADFLPDADEIERSPLPPFAQMTVRALVAALTLFIVWASVSSIDEIVVAHGRIINPLPNVVVQPLETSIVQKIDVRVGQVVRKGEQLATLDPTFAQADEAQLRSRLRSLDTQTGSLQAELDGAAGAGRATDADGLLQAQLSKERKANYRAQLGKMEQTISRLAAALETNRRDQLILTARVKSLREIENMQAKLVAQQFGARLHLLEAQDRRLEVDRELSLTENKEHELRSELASSEAEKSAFVKGWRQKALEELLSTSRERDGVNEQLQKADKRRKLVTLSAPVDGVVLEIAKLSPGSIVKEAESFFTLVPLNAELEAEVQIDSVDIGYIKSGDEVQLKLDAFPYQRHGGLQARVRTISEDAFKRDNQMQGNGTDAYYLSRLKIGTPRLKKMDAHARILPGMTVTAEIVVGKRSVISYLLWPLTKAMDESLKEP